MNRRRTLSACHRFALALPCLVMMAAAPAVAADFPRFEAQQIDPHAGAIVYAVTVADVNGDKKPDVVAVTEDAVVWYANPGWGRHDLIRQATERDNVCIQPHDVDGDGRIDFALGAGWRPPDTKNPSTLQWLGRDAEGRWQVHPIKYDEPTLHRLRWGKVKGDADGRKQLVVAALQGAGRRGRTGGPGRGCGFSSTTSPPARPPPNGRSRSPTRRCTRSTTCSSSTSMATTATRSCSRRGRGSSSFVGAPTGAGRGPRSARATRSRGRRRGRAR